MSMSHQCGYPDDENLSSDFPSSRPGWFRHRGLGEIPKAVSTDGTDLQVGHIKVSLCVEGCGERRWRGSQNGRWKMVKSGEEIYTASSSKNQFCWWGLTFIQVAWIVLEQGRRSTVIPLWCHWEGYGNPCFVDHLQRGVEPLEWIQPNEKQTLPGKRKENVKRRESDGHRC